MPENRDAILDRLAGYDRFNFCCNPNKIRSRLAEIHALIRAIKEDPRFVIVTLPEIEAKRKPKAAAVKKV